jgi:hypothetical protein
MTAIDRLTYPSAHHLPESGPDRRQDGRAFSHYLKIRHHAMNHPLHHLALISLIALLGSLQGCKSLQGKPEPSSPISSQSAPPAWVSQPPTDNRATIFGLGSGRDLETAKQNALNDIAGKLEVHVSSDTEYRNLIRNDQASSSFSERIKTKVKQTRLSNYQIRETTFVNGTAFTLIAMSRDALIRDTQTELDKAQSELDVLLSGIERKSKLEQLVTFTQAGNRARDALPTVALMSAANPEFDSKAWYQKLRQFSDREKALSEQATFRVSGSPSLKTLAQRLQMKLSEQKFRVTQSSQADIQIELAGELQKQEIFSSFSSFGDMHVIVRTGEGKQLFSSVHRLQGSSVSGYEQATENAFRKFESSLTSRNDIFALLGLNLNP